MKFMLNSNKMFFMFILIFSTLISISSNTWLGCWIGLEINLLSFIPLISNVNNLLSSEASMKYFLIQSIASINFLFFILFKLMLVKNFNLIYFKILFNLPLLMKMGCAPFHFWFPNIMEGLSWMNCFILMTWQKISPMILLSYYFNKNFLILIIIINAFISSLSGINQTSIRKLMAFSSINNLSWMLSSIMISENLWILYFSIYSLLSFIVCFMMFTMNMSFINQLFFINMKSMIKMTLFFNFLSLGGLPPFLGFFPKWMVINFLIMNNNLILTFILVMTSLIMLFFYIRMTFSSFLINYSKLKWFKFKTKNFYLFIFYISCLISLMGLPISTFFYI
uniref:NADH dehydrogenase subunit 2 n=1 Tax=Acrolepiopsis assectella TaxID=57686 RepID=UPI0020371684|nr:NADH dehydrogenase subunit 2 [Acrolepiopsis assectella]UQV94868.1 NADH dehydrogenase subunit 2 [Acrolepiopsis assectella]